MYSNSVPFFLKKCANFFKVSLLLLLVAIFSQPAFASISKINDWAIRVTGAAEPTLSDYTSVVTINNTAIVTELNRSFQLQHALNHWPRGDTDSNKIVYLQDMVDGFEAIYAWVNGLPGASRPTVDDYVKSGFDQWTDVNASTIDYINDQVGPYNSQLLLAEQFRWILDYYVEILDYADGSSSRFPGVGVEYRTYGALIYGKTANYWSHDIWGSEMRDLSRDLMLTSLDQIRQIGYAYFRIYEYARGRSTPLPTLTDYHDIGITYLSTQAELDSLNSAIRAFKLKKIDEIESVARLFIVQLEHPTPLAQGSTVSLTLADEARFGQTQIDWYRFDGANEFLLQSDQKTLSIQSGQLQPGERVFARLNAGSKQYDSRVSGGYIGDSGSPVDIALTHNQSNAYASSGKTLEITNASLLVNDLVVTASAPNYQWFAFNEYDDFGQSRLSLTSGVALQSPSTNSHYTVNNSEQANYYAVEVTFNYLGQDHRKVVTFSTTPALLRYQDDDPQFYENLLFNEMNLSSNLKVWLDATDEQTLFSDSSCNVPANDGDPIACWQDKSANAAHFYDLNSNDPGGVGADASRDYGLPTYINSYDDFSGASAVSFDSADLESLAHQLQSSDYWDGDFSVAMGMMPNKDILNPLSAGNMVYSVFSTNVATSDLSRYYVNYTSRSSQVTENSGTNRTGGLINKRVYTAQYEYPRVLSSTNECKLYGSPTTDVECTFIEKRNGVSSSTAQVIRNNVELFRNYALNTPGLYLDNEFGDTAFQSLMIFDKKLDKCESYIVDKYLSLKMGSTLSSNLTISQSASGFALEKRTLGFDMQPSFACKQDIFLSQASSGYMDVSFELNNPSVSDYDLIARDEYLIVGHNGADVASLVDISNMASQPLLPAGSSVTDVLERKWLVDFKSVSGVAAPIKQVSLKYDFTLGGLDLSTPNYPKPYLVIQRGNVPIEIEGYYQGEDSVAFDPIDFQHGDTVQLAFNQNAANNPPTSSNHSIFIDSTHAFSANDFKFSDPDNDAFYQVRITSLPTQGTLTFNGSLVTVNQDISVSDLALLSLNFDNTATLPIGLKYQVSDGIQWSNESDLSINQLKIHHQLSPKHVTYRVGDELSIHTLAELNYQPLSVSVDYVWWTVNSGNNIGEYYDPIQHTALSVEDSYTVSSSSIGKYLLVQAEYTESTSGQSVKSILPIGFIKAADAPTRPTEPWASQLNVNSQYVYENLTIVPDLALRNDDEVLPTDVAYCFYDEDTDSVLQACGAADTFTVSSTDKDKTIRVEAILRDSNSPTIEAQTLTAYLFPRSTTNDLTRPDISPTQDLTLFSTVSLTSEPRFQTSGTKYQWYRYRNGQYTSINGATGDSYTISWADMSATILLQVTVDDNGTMVPIESNMTENVEYQLAVDMVLGHETPLHVYDEITILNKSGVEQAVQGIIAKNGNFEASYTWQYSPDNGISWFDQATSSSITPLILLDNNRIYRLRLDIGDGLALVVVYSNNSPAVQSGLSYNIDVEPLSAPIEDVSYDVYSQLTSSLG
ncbi:hypothetical protein, partial [Photobacterium leiognathi]|uniref:hypothetical protein n=1 Tax=Photobacterium leiognathi TaxID=553611 RepID=UPI0005BD93A9